MSMTTRCRNSRDTGYSWVVLLCVFVVAFFHLGIVKVFGVFVPEIVEQLGMSMWAVGMSCSIGISLNAILGPVWTAATHITSYRTLTVLGGFVSSFGVICLSFSKSGVHLAVSMALISVGAGLPLVAKVVALRDYFEAKFSMANGIALTGGALGFTIFAPLMEHFIKQYGWRGAMLIYSAMNFNVCVAGMLMVQPRGISRTSTRVEVVSETNSSQPVPRSRRCKTGDYLKRTLDYFGFSVLVHYPVLNIYFIAMAFHEFVAGGWVLFLVPYSVSLGYSTQISSFLITMGGGGAIVGRLVVGPFIDNGLISGRRMFFVLAISGATVMFSYPFTAIYWILSIVSFMTGFFLASTGPIFVVMLKEILQEDSDGFAGAVGLHYLARGLGTLAGGPITGWLNDATGSFHLPFITLAVLEFGAAIMTLVKPSYLPQIQGYKILRQA